MLLVLTAALLRPSVQIDSATLRHGGSRPPPTITAVRVTRPPDLDGRLDAPAWAEAVPARGFTEVDPLEGTTPAESTTVRLVYDDAAIYVGARLYAAPGETTSRLGRRDDDTQSDMFYVDFDSYHDHRTSFEFGVNAVGVKQDGICSNDYFVCDRSWDPVWEEATAIDSLGWVVEMRIPFSQLRFPPVRDQVWGVNFFRWVFGRNEFSQWAFQRKTETGYSSRFGHLLGLRDIPAPKRLEVLPYTLARGTYDSPDPRNPFDPGHTYLGGAGLDLKYGVTSNLTLDAAVNPDFGQVEADPAFVNLTAFERFLPEHRPLFVEGASIFTFGGTGPLISFTNTPQYFYSRRIGRTPSLVPQAPSGGFLKLPDATAILGAAKLTEKSASGWSAGFLDAVTAREQASFDSGGRQWREEVEPFANYAVARVRRELGGHTGFGLIATAVDRGPRTAATDSLRRGAYVGGADFYHRWANNAYSLFASVGVSHVTGDTVALQATQQEPARYYQRPDASYLHNDPHRTFLTGVTADVAVNKEGGNNNWAVAVSASSPGFEVNDLGFQQRADQISADVWLGHRWTVPGRVFRQASVSVEPADTHWNFGGDRVVFLNSLYLFGRLRNYWSGTAYLVHQHPVLDDRLTRGGPIARQPESWSVSATLTSDQRQAANTTIGVNAYHDAAGTRSLSVSPTLYLRPSAAVAAQLGISYTTGWTAAQFVVVHRDPTATATYGSRYIFGELDQRQLSTTLRLNVTFTPTLSLQWYAQPFTFAGRYGAFKELRTPRSFTFNVYGRDNQSSISYDATAAVYTVHPTASATDTIQFATPDSRVRSLRSNAVLRWDYRPGSTLFVVWSHSRYASVTDPALDLGRYLAREVFRDPPTNVLLVKVNYWLSL